MYLSVFIIIGNIYLGVAFRVTFLFWFTSNFDSSQLLLLCTYLLGFLLNFSVFAAGEYGQTE